MLRRQIRWLAAAALLLAMAVPAFAGSGPARADDGTSRYRQTNLVSDVSNPPGGPARHMDRNLVNPWGIATGPTTPIWISDNNAGVSTVYNGDGQTQRPPVTIPAPGSPTGGTPTGVVFNPTDDFSVSAHSKTGKAVFIFATEDGTIAGWSPAVDSNNAIIAVDNSTKPTVANGAVYKGLALASSEGKNYLYATNFRAGTVDVFDRTFTQVNVGGEFKFSDPNIPSGFAPFNIRLTGGDLYVTYAKQNAEKHDDVAGPGDGFIDIFEPGGRLERRFASRGSLNSPWGLAVAPDDFGQFGGHLLVGNFGDGRITGFDRNGRSDGQLKNLNGQVLSIPGLWGLRVGNGGSGGDQNTVYFTAGIDDESHGLFGSLSPSGEPESDER